MDTLLSIYQFVIGTVNTIATDLTKGEAVSKGLVTVAILGGILMVLRNTPSKIKAWLIARYTVQVSFTNSWDAYNREMFRVAGDFVARHQYKKNFKILRTNINYRDGTVSNDLSISSSSGWFLLKGLPIFYALEEAKENGAVPEQLYIRIFGRTAEKVLAMIDAEKQILKDYHHRRFYSWNNDSWVSQGNIVKDTPIFLDPEIKKEIDRKVDFFRDHKDWFERRGISHKLMIVLEGMPGTGKSRLARYVADRLGWSLGTFMGGALTKAVRSGATQDIVVSIPDVDAIGIGKARTGLDLKLAQQRLEKERAKESADRPSGLIVDVGSDGVTTMRNKPDSSLAAGSLNEVSTETDSLIAFSRSLNDTALAEALNLFQGDIPLNNSVVVMSTNCIEDIDAAMLRPSRCDLVLTIGELSYEQFNEFFQYYYETVMHLPDILKTRTFRACDLMEAFTENAFDKQGFLDNLLTRN